jgi:hypothetical protein
MAVRKDLCRNCCNYLDLPFKKKPQCKMGVREFACLIPIAVGVMLPPITSSEVSANDGTKRKAPDVDYSESPRRNLPELYKKAVEEEAKNQKLLTNF